MLLYRNVNPEYVARLRVGGFFENATITDVMKKNDYISIVTSTGDVYNIHYTPKGCNVFLRRKDRK